MKLRLSFEATVDGEWEMEGPYPFGELSGCQMMKLHGSDSVNVKTDALLVVQNLSRAKDTFSFNFLLLDINDSISQFNCLTISFAKQYANSVVHLLAR